MNYLTIVLPDDRSRLDLRCHVRFIEAHGPDNAAMAALGGTSIGDTVLVVPDRGRGTDTKQSAYAFRRNATPVVPA